MSHVHPITDHVDADGGGPQVQELPALVLYYWKKFGVHESAGSGWSRHLECNSGLSVTTPAGVLLVCKLSVRRSFQAT